MKWNETKGNETKWSEIMKWHEMTWKPCSWDDKPCSLSFLRWMAGLLFFEEMPQVRGWIRIHQKSSSILFLLKLVPLLSTSHSFIHSLNKGWSHLLWARCSNIGHGFIFNKLPIQYRKYIDAMQVTIIQCGKKNHTDVQALWGKRSGRLLGGPDTCAESEV